MPIATLAKISPLDTGTGSRVDIYLSSIQDGDTNGLNSQIWEPAILQAPALGISLWAGDFTTPADPAQAALQITMETVKLRWANAENYVWIGAPVTIYADQVGTAWPWTTRFTGRVKSFPSKGRTRTLTADVDKSGLQKNILTTVYAGTGGAEGGADLKNRLKPLVMGWAMNVEPVLVDATNSVYQFSGYGAIEAVTTLYERGSDFGAAQADYASYSALAAATIPAGKWGTCLASGMIRLGAPAYGVITADVKGHKVGANTPRLTGAVINALATIAGVSSGLINTTSLTALDAAKAYNTNHVITEQTTWLEYAQRLTLACNWSPCISLTGIFFVSSVSLSGTEVITLDAQGGAYPQVSSAEERDTSVPYSKITMGANRSWRVHTTDEIAFNYPIIDLGLYSASTTYRAGNLVWQPDKSSWLYINATALSGNAPPTWPTTSNAYWQNSSPPLDAAAAGITSAGGTLSVLGSFTSVIGNSIVKSGGTHGAFQGGVVGNPIAGACYVSASVFTVNTWGTTLCLDNDATNFVPLVSGMPYSAVLTRGPFDTGDVVLWAGATLIGGGSVAVSGLTANSRMALIYDGTKVSVVVDGVAVRSTSAAADQKLWPKVLDYYNSGASGYSTFDIQYGPFTQNNWSALGGTGLPEDSATVSDNLIRNASLSSSLRDVWSGTMTRTAGVAANNDPLFYARTTGTQGGYINTAAKVPCTPGSTLYLSTLARDATASASNLARFSIAYYKADGTSLSSVSVDTSINSTTWAERRNTAIVPTGAASFDAQIVGVLVSGASADIASPRIALTERSADVTANAQVGIEMVTDKSIDATYDGTLTGALSSILWVPAVTKAGQSIRILDSTTYALSNESGGTFARDNTNGSSTKGHVTITAMSSLIATADLTITVAGIAQPPIKLKLEKRLGPAPSGSATYGSVASWTYGEFDAISATSYTVLTSSIKTVSLTSGQVMTGGGTLIYAPNYSAGLDARTMTFKWQYSVAGANSWNDFSTGIAGTTSYSWGDSGSPDYTYIEAVYGVVTVAQTKSGLSTGDYDIRMVALCDATGLDCYTYGTVAVTVA